MATKKNKDLSQQMGLFSSVIEKPKTQEDVFDLPDIAVSFNIFAHGNAKRQLIEAKERQLVSAFKNEKVNVLYNSPVVLGRAHERVFTELLALYAEMGSPIHERLEITYAHLTRLCGLQHGTSNIRETKRRLFDLRYTVITIKDNSLVDDLIHKWDLLMASEPTEENLQMLNLIYRDEINHLRQVRAKNNTGFITLNLIESLAGEDSEGALFEGIDSAPVSGTIGVRLNPLLALFYSNNRNIFIAKEFEKYISCDFSLRILFLLKARSIQHDRYLAENFLAWFMPPGWKQFSSKQEKYKIITKILDSFKEVENLGQLVDGIRFVKTSRSDYGTSGNIVVNSRKQQVYKICNIERISPLADSILVKAEEQRNSPLFRLFAILQATKTSWGLRPWSDDHIIVAKEIKEKKSIVANTTVYRDQIPYKEIYERLKEHKWCFESKTTTNDIDTLKVILKMMNRLKELELIESYTYDQETEMFSNIELADKIVQCIRERNTYKTEKKAFI